MNGKEHEGRVEGWRCNSWRHDWNIWDIRMPRQSEDQPPSRLDTSGSLSSGDHLITHEKSVALTDH